MYNQSKNENHHHTHCQFVEINNLDVLFPSGRKFSNLHGNFNHDTSAIGHTLHLQDNMSSNEHTHPNTQLTSPLFRYSYLSAKSENSLGEPYKLIKQGPYVGRNPAIGKKCTPNGQYSLQTSHTTQSNTCIGNTCQNTSQYIVLFACCCNANRHESIWNKFLKAKSPRMLV